MTITPSITIWTIINFLLTMFLLDRFLYKPMLKHLDRRRARIEASQKDLEARKAAQLAEQDALLEEKKAEMDRRTGPDGELAALKQHDREEIAKAKTAAEEHIRLHQAEADEGVEAALSGADLSALTDAVVDSILP